MLDWIFDLDDTTWFAEGLDLDKDYLISVCKDGWFFTHGLRFQTLAEAQAFCQKVENVLVDEVAREIENANVKGVRHAASCPSSKTE